MMIRALIVATLVSTAMACTWQLFPTAMPSEAERDKAQHAVDEFTNLVQLTPYFEQAVAYAVFPGAFRASTGFGVGYGRGWVLRDGEIVGRTTMFHLSVGANFGARWYRQILFFKTEDALRRWQRGTFEFGGEAGAAVGIWGAAVSPSFNTEVALFTKLRSGLLVEANVGANRYEYAPIQATLEAH